MELPALPAHVELDRHALVVVDVQRGFADPAWGRRAEPGADERIGALVARWRERSRPLVLVRHDSVVPGSPPAPGRPGNDLSDVVAGPADLLVAKHVNSSFHGDVDLDAWLRERALAGIVVCGLTTNHCCETTARVGGNLGHDVLFALDATATFDRAAPDGSVIPGEELMRVTATNLHGEFATVTSTRALLDA